MSASLTLAPLPAQVLPFLTALADESRLAIIRLLARTDLRVSELGERLHLPQNVVSYHLKKLRALDILHDHRSSNDARDVYYRIDLDRLQALYQAAGAVLHPGLAPAPAPAGVDSWRERPLRVLFLCTHNSARSQLAEGILRHLGRENVEVYSAGSEPTAIHPDTLRLLAELGADPARHYAKALDQFAGQSFDYIITVCDRVRDRCPVFPNDPERIHWSIPDPVTVAAADARWAAFCAVRQDLYTRIRYLLTLPHPATGQRLQMPVPGAAQEGRP